MRRAGFTAALMLGIAMFSAAPAATAANETFVATQGPGLSTDGSGLRLSAVDCASVGNCVAVGTDGSVGAIDVESDGDWSAVPLSDRTGASPTALTAVSCPAAGACVAVGQDGSQALVETQSGTTWNGIVVTGDGGLYSAAYEGSLASVACPAAGSCAAVGQAFVNNKTTGAEDAEGLIADLIPNNPPSTGSEWSAQKAPEYYSDAPEAASLAGVACSAPGECRAVGYAEDDSTNHYQYALIDDEKSYAWAYGAAAAPADTGGGSAGLTAISCVGDTFTCMAAGYYPQQNHGAQPMIQTIDSKDSAQVSSGLVPIEDTSANLLATSCASDGTCESVGSAYDDPGDPTYGYGYDGYIVSHTYGAPAGQSAGVVAANTYSPADANTVQHNETLTAASCVSGGFCIAVGNYVDGNNDEAGVIDTRVYDSDGNISSETDVRAPEPSNDPSTDNQAPLGGVNCEDATDCVAVGSFLNDTDAPHGVIETLGESQVAAVPPKVSAVSPKSGKAAGGTKVTITGSNLAGATAVHFGNTAGMKLTVLSETKITVTSPAHTAGSVDITVTTDGGTSTKATVDHFSYIAVPQVKSVSPSSGSHKGGTTVTISGTALSGATRVTFGSTTASHVKVMSATKLKVTSPKHNKGSVNIRVTTPGGSSAENKANRFTYH